jgi:hypothetical protein
MLQHAQPWYSPLSRKVSEENHVAQPCTQDEQKPRPHSPISALFDHAWHGAARFTRLMLLRLSSEGANRKQRLNHALWLRTPVIDSVRENGDA